MAIEGQLGGNVALDNVEHAKQALARSDLAQALFHASSALATDPTNREWRALIAKVREPANFKFMVAGGTAGRFTAVIAGWTFPKMSRMVTRPIHDGP